MEIERSLVKESALAVAGTLLGPRESQSSFKKWHKLSKYAQTHILYTFTHFGLTDGQLTALKSVHVLNLA